MSKRILAEMPELVPSWLRAWYLLNLLVLPYDWLFIMLRPRSLASGDLAYLFGPINLYAQYDPLFAEPAHKITFYIYVIGAFDLALCAYLFYILTVDTLSRERPSTAVLALVRAASIATKTAVYVMYSWEYLASYQIAITAMNSTWILVPICVAISVSNRLCAAYPALSKRA